MTIIVSWRSPSSHGVWWWFYVVLIRADFDMYEILHGPTFTRSGKWANHVILSWSYRYSNLNQNGGSHTFPSWHIHMICMNSMIRTTCTTRRCKRNDSPAAYVRDPKIDGNVRHQCWLVWRMQLASLEYLDASAEELGLNPVSSTAVVGWSQISAVKLAAIHHAWVSGPFLILIAPGATSALTLYSRWPLICRSFSMIEYCIIHLHLAPHNPPP